MAEYIEREALIKNFAANAVHCISFGDSGVGRGYIAAKEVVVSFPAADVAPVVYGKWIMRGGRFRCSVCDEKALLKDVGGTGGFSHEYEQVKSSLCPSCGAKMGDD